MNDEVLRWLIGEAGAILLGCGAMLVGSFRWLQGRIDAQSVEIRTAVDNKADISDRADGQLHERINRLREEVSKDYARSKDLDANVARIENSIKEMRAETREAIKDGFDRFDNALRDLAARIDSLGTRHARSSSARKIAK